MKGVSSLAPALAPPLGRFERDGGGRENGRLTIGSGLVSVQGGTRICVCMRMRVTRKLQYPSLLSPLSSPTHAARPTHRAVIAQIPFARIAGSVPSLTPLPTSPSSIQGKKLVRKWELKMGTRCSRRSLRG